MKPTTTGTTGVKEATVWDTATNHYYELNVRDEDTPSPEFQFIKKYRLGEKWKNIDYVSWKSVSKSEPLPDDTAAAKPAATRPAEEPVEKPTRTAAADTPVASTPRPAASGVGFAVQLGAFSNATDANALRDRARAAGLGAFVEQVNTDKGELSRVQVGPVADRAAAERLKAQVAAKLGIEGFVHAHP